MGLPAKPTRLPTIKGFLLGYSGTAKTSSVFSLAIAGPIAGCMVPGPGLSLYIIDFDTKAEEMAYAILGGFLSRGHITQSQYEDALSRIEIAACVEPMGTITVKEGTKMIQKLGIKGVPSAWATAVKTIDKWLPSLNDSSVLVVDSITHAGHAAVNWCQQLNGKLNKEMTWQDYQCPQAKMSDLLITLSELPCHVLMIGHQNPVDLYKNTDRIDDKTGKPEQELMDTIVVPISVGKAKSVEIPTKYNHLLAFAEEGIGGATTRYLYTVPKGGVITKTPFFSKAKPKYPITTGLVEYFALRD